MSKIPSEMAEAGEITLTEGDGRACVECGKPVNKYLWSPLFCPKCDKQRMDRIDKNMKNISNKFKR